MFKVAFPVLLTVTVCGALVVPGACIAKTRPCEDRLTIGAGATPVPESGTVSGPPTGRVSVIVRLPTRTPGVAGVKVTLIEQLAPAGTLPGQLFVSAKPAAFPPVIAMLVMF